VNGASWQARTAVALLIGAAGEGACILLTEWVAGGFVLATILVALIVGWRFGPWVGGAGAGIPPLGLVFVSSGHDDYIGERISAALAVVLLLGGSAWVAGRVRERYGKPPWGHSEGASQ
jgi:hypothetical protein